MKCLHQHMWNPVNRFKVYTFMYLDNLKLGIPPVKCVCVCIYIPTFLNAVLVIYNILNCDYKWYAQLTLRNKQKKAYNILYIVQTVHFSSNSLQYSPLYSFIVV